MNNLSTIYKRFLRRMRYSGVYNRVSKYTMLTKNQFFLNCELYEYHMHVNGCVVECGVWKGGMSAALAYLSRDKKSFYLFDSFEGLPDAEIIDGEKAKEYQNRHDAAEYYENCKADEKYAYEIMSKTNQQFQIVKGWFEDTLNITQFESPIAILRVDCDWYSPTLLVLTSLSKHLANGGIIILDDYYTWEGCKKAVHQFLLDQDSLFCLHQFNNGVAYLKKIG